MGLAQILTPATPITITKTWSQQPSGYTYPISISVPPGLVPPDGFPVCILLHGNGSQNLGNLAGPPMISQGQFGSTLPCHILVAPTGYQNSWNICAENSDAPDLEMIHDLVNLSISNTNDNLIPYLGGPSVVGANFLPAETAAFNIATHKGHTGSILTSGTVTGSGTTAITEYSYLSGGVVHIKGSAGHQANGTQKAYITNYFSDCDAVTGVEEKDLPKIKVYPNPATKLVNVTFDSSLVGSDYTVYDHMGRTHLFGKINSENINIDLTGLSKGIYFLSIGVDSKHVTKIMKE